LAFRHIHVVRFKRAVSGITRSKSLQNNNIATFQPSGDGFRASLEASGDMARTERVRVPNPKKPGKGRLDAPPAKAHRPKKAYRRRAKHPGREPFE
jgi:hypothetical protein